MSNQKDIVQLREELLLQSKSSKKWWKIPIKILTLLIAIAYTIMPADLVLDSIPIIGTMDDAGVWILNLSMYIREIKKNKTELEKIISQISELVK